jgi:hypothetical protein
MFFNFSDYPGVGNRVNPMMKLYANARQNISFSARLVFGLVTSMPTNGASPNAIVRQERKSGLW